MKKHILISSILAIFILTGCSMKEVETKKPIQDIVHTYTLDQTILALADVLSMNLMKKNVETGDIAMTTFVQLNDFTKTSKFGRLLSESLFHELNAKGVTLLDFRAKKTLSINADGEFYLSRNVSSLKKSIHSKHILVGTYSKTINSNSLLINARIINSKNGRVISTSSVLLHKYDCRLFNNCKVSNRPIRLTSK